MAGSASHQLVFRLLKDRLSNLIFRANFVKLHFELAIFPIFSGIFPKTLASAGTKERHRRRRYYGHDTATEHTTIIIIITHIKHIYHTITHSIHLPTGTRHNTYTLHTRNINNSIECITEFPQLNVNHP